MKLKNIIQTFSIALLLTFHTMNSQTINYEWATNAIGKGDDRGNKIIADPNGNVIVCGRYRGNEILFGDIKLTNAAPDSGSADAFIVKYDQNGKALWAKGIGGNQEDIGMDCATDKNGNIAFVISFDSPEMILENRKIINNTKNRAGSDILIIQFTPKGEITWIKSYGGVEHDGVASCQYDNKNNLFVTGSFASQTFSMESIQLINSDKGQDTFIAKFSPDGKMLWTKSIPGPHWNTSENCSVDPEGNLIVCGTFIGRTVTFDTLTFQKSGEKYCDIFVAKYSPEGKLKWAKSYGGPAMEIAKCATDKKGNIVLAGMFTDSVLKIGNTTLYNYGKGNQNSTQFAKGQKSNLLLFKIDASGKELWSKTATGNATAAGIRNFNIDSNGNIIIGGSFEGDTLIIGKNILKNNISETEDIFIAAYSPEGAELWATSIGGTGRNVARSTASDKKGNVYVTGSFENPKLSLGSSTLTNSGDPDVFIIKLSTH